MLVHAPIADIQGRDIKHGRPGICGGMRERCAAQEACGECLPARRHRTGAGAPQARHEALLVEGMATRQSLPLVRGTCSQCAIADAACLRESTRRCAGRRRPPGWCAATESKSAATERQRCRYPSRRRNSKPRTTECRRCRQPSKERGRRGSHVSLPKRSWRGEQASEALGRASLRGDGSRSEHRLLSASAVGT